MAASTTASTAVPLGKARLLYCKSRVAIHPTQSSKDNITGYLGIVEADSEAGGAGVQTDEEGKVVTQNNGKELLITWVPDELLQRMDEKDRQGYKLVEDRSTRYSSAEEVEEEGEYTGRRGAVLRHQALCSLLCHRRRERSMPSRSRSRGFTVSSCTLPVFSTGMARRLSSESSQHPTP